MKINLLVKYQDLLVGQIIFDNETDQFSLVYSNAWNQEYGFGLSNRLTPEKLKQLSDSQLSIEIKRFLENILPEGVALDHVSTLYQVSKSNIAGLLIKIGREGAGAFAFLLAPIGMPENLAIENTEPEFREIDYKELNDRILNRDQIPFCAWDGKVRMSIAGFQDKLSVYLDDGDRIFLVDGNASSTYILKPIPHRNALKHLVINEFFCMSLGRMSGIATANVKLIRVPSPVLLVERFDRKVLADGSIQRVHIIDGCQALGLSPSHKYERNLGSSRDVKDVRDGVSLQKLFELAQVSDNKASETLKLLRWTIFQYLIGNTDGHGKNLSYFVDKSGIKLAPSYDMVACEMHDCVDHEIGMAIGNEFLFKNVGAFDWAEMAFSCNINKRNMEREMKKMAKAVAQALDSVTIDLVDEEEKEYMASIRVFVQGRVDRLVEDAKMVAQAFDDILSEEENESFGPC